MTGKSECNCRAYHLYWPQDGLCYRELTQGPCPTGFKLVWDVLQEKAECQCPPFWSQADDGQCYEEYSKVNFFSNFQVIRPIQLLLYLLFVYFFYAVL